LLKQLWKALQPMWKEEGYTQSKRASEVFLGKYRETGKVLDAIPAHHFAQFEASQKHIQASLEKGKLLVTPLFFASGGGFSFDFADAHYLGYGIQSERLFEKLSARVEQIAPKMKALSDPTRLMMLTLIARYENFVLTVGDLAVQLGVTQPTASGHLKLLREAGLVALEKHGNKSYYHVSDVAIKEAMAELSDLVLRPK
jgi:ArsR family transcriptional regulator